MNFANHVLEFGPADGFWSCWPRKLGASKIVGVDFREYQTYRKVVEIFDLPVDYYPGLISTETLKKVKGTFRCIVSLAILYHIHDVLTTLIMYHNELST